MTAPPDRFEITDAQVIDWYDGPVTAVVTERAGGRWVAFLLAAPDEGPRIFGLVPTTPARAAVIEAALDDPAEFDEAQRLFHCAMAESEGPLLLLRATRLAGEAAPGDRAALDWARYRGRVTFSAEEAHEPRRVEAWTLELEDAAGSP